MEQLPSPAPLERPSVPAGLLWVGWKEYIDLPDWGIRRVKAKMDTGARTSALDVVSYELREVNREDLVAELKLALDRRHRERLTLIQVPVLRMIGVCNTGGIREQRPLIETTIQLGPLRKTVLMTVTNRAGMRFPMILGRTALAGDCVVDVSRKYLLRNR
jgi:hypothetical protein